ncbi:MAG: hypothetical protein ACOYNO_12270, partial [Saprospiraceae bacterium]
MENLDEFMRRKFNEPTADDDARFDFKEEYWLQAEALIKQDERRRRAAIWWWRTGVATALLLLLLLLLWRTCGQYSVKTDAPPLNQQQARQTQRPQTNKHIPEAPLPTHPNQPLGNLLITTPSDTALANGSWHPAANELPAYPGHNPHPDHTAKSNAALHQPAPHKPSNTNPTPHIPTPAEAIKTPKSPDADDLSEQASAPTLSPHLVRIETLGLLDLPFPGPSPDKMRPDLSPVPNPVAYTEVPDVNRHWVWYAQTGATTYPDISPDWSFHAGAGVIRP